MGYREHLATVEAMVSEGVPFETIEETIETTALSDEAKSALWLYAWAEQPREARHEVVTSVLTL